MSRRKHILFIALLLSLAVFASHKTQALPDTDALSKACYAKVGPVLQNARGRLTPEVRNAYLDWAEQTVLQELHQSSQIVPETCLVEVRRDAMLREAIFGSVFPPDPSIFQNYAQLRAQLGEKLLAKYRSLVIAMAVAKRVKGVDRAGESKDFGRDYQPGFWVDESLQVPGSEAEKDFVRRIADFMKQSQVSAADLYHNSALQEQLRAALARQSVPAGFIAEVRKSVPFGERLKYAMVLLGQRPAAREAKPTTVAWLRHLIAIHESMPTSTPTLDGKPMPWPLFPINTAPWPLLMPLAHPIPLSEANYIWEAFQGQHGPDRYHTYGPYRGDDDVIPDSLRPSKWFWDAWPDRIIHGGMCVPLSKGTVDLYSALGKPAMWAGQPGHANLISFQYVGNAWTAEIEQAFAGGPDVTSAQWYFDEDPGTQIRFRDLYYWAGAEYHLGLALAMNVGVKSYMETRLVANLFRVLPSEEKRTLGVTLLRSAIVGNPYNPELWYRLAAHIPDAMQGLAVAEAVAKRKGSLLSDRPGDIAPEMRKGGPAYDQYWQTLAQFVTPVSFLVRPAPQKEEDMRRVHAFLKTAPGIRGEDAAAYVEKFAESLPAASDAASLEYARNLANQGDVYGQLRMGQRYRDGEGVPQSDTKAQGFLALAAGQGDPAAACILANLYPALPGHLINVTASHVFSQDQLAQHLVDGAGMVGAIHDNEGSARTMWHTGPPNEPRPPARNLPPSPAWVRFDFARPTKFDSLLIWNHNQAKLTDRGFKRTRIYGSSDGIAWIPLTATRVVELPRASGSPGLLPVTVPNAAAGQAFKAVIIAAEPVDGNYGSTVYGLSAVRFVVRRLSHVIPAKAITVTASSVFGPMQAAHHLVDGAGMLGALHDNAESAQTMWHTPGGPAVQPPAPGLAPSPAWVRFDFAQPQQVTDILIWNHNQINLTDRGFRKVRVYGSSDGMTWQILTSSPTFQLPRASGASLIEPFAISNQLAEHALKAVIIAAEAVDGNYGSTVYGLSAVRFVMRQ